MNGMAFGQYIPRPSIIHHLDPRAKLFVVAVMMAAILMVDSAPGVALTITYTGIMMLFSQIPVRVYGEGSKALLVILLITVAFQVLLVPGNVLYTWWIFSISDAGIKMGALMGYRLTMVFVLAQLLTFTTSPLQLTDALERSLRPFERVGVPAHELAMIMTIALSFIPVFFEEADKITRAQMSRGANFQGGIRNARNLVAIIVPLFSRAFSRADELALAMESRCYTGGAGRTRMYNLTLKKKDYIAMAVTTIIAMFIFSGI